MEVVNHMRPTDPARLDHAVKLYMAGKPFKEAAAEASVSRSPFYRELHRRGIETPDPRTHVLPVTEIVEKYRGGRSVLGLSKEYGVVRLVIGRILREAGVPTRGNSQAQHLRYIRTTRSERQAITAAANAAARGVPQPEERQVKRALTRQSQPPIMSTHERRLAGWLSKRHVPYAREKAVGRYNLDFAVESVAVEVLGGEWHNTRVKAMLHGRRTPYILDQGWAIAFVWATPSHPMTEKVADEIVAYVDETRRDPSLIGEYRVIRGDGQLLARGRKEDYERTGIVPARDR